VLVLPSFWIEQKLPKGTHKGYHKQLEIQPHDHEDEHDPSSKTKNKQSVNFLT
jgi:hypothetical protein